MTEKTKKQKMQQIGEIRAIKRFSKYLEKLKWSYHGSIEDFSPKMFDVENKRNTKDYFKSISVWFEQFFTELFYNLDSSNVGYGQQNDQTKFYYKFKEQLKEHLKALESIGEKSEEETD